MKVSSYKISFSAHTHAISIVIPFILFTMYVLLFSLCSLTFLKHTLRTLIFRTTINNDNAHHLRKVFLKENILYPHFRGSNHWVDSVNRNTPIPPPRLALHQSRPVIFFTPRRMFIIPLFFFVFLLFLD